MDFPADYDTRMFPETRYLSMARSFAIWSAVLFLLIIGLSWTLVWTMRSSRTEPVLVSISDDGKNWIAIIGGDTRLKYSAARVMQESVVANFTQRWFKISRDAKENDDNWCKCEPEKCWSDELMPIRCNVCCSSSVNVFTSFLGVVNSDFRVRATSGEEWFVVPNSIRTIPMGIISDKGGLWRLTASINMGDDKIQNIEAFVRTSKSEEGYPATLGYYVTDFHAYPAEQ